MDIKLPDGTILRGVPEGTTKEQIREKLAAKGYDVSKLDAPKTFGQDPIAPPDQRQSGYKATLDTAPKPVAKPTATGVVDAATRGISPYAIAAGAGAGLGSLGGGVGAVPGAAAGVTALAATDLASFGWNNTAVPWLGAPEMLSGSDALRGLTDTVGVTRPLADDPNARIVYNIFNTAGSSIGAGNLMQMGGQALAKAPGALGAVGNFFAKPMSAQSMVAGGAAGGGVSQAATEMGADPLVALGLGTVASMAGGGLATPKQTPATPAPSAAQLGARKAAAYDAAHAQGVEWTPATIDTLADSALRDALSPTHPGGPMPTAAVAPALRDALRSMSDAAATTGRMDSRNLDFFRQEIGKVVSSLSGAERAVAQRVKESLDDMTSAPERTINALRGNVASARGALQQAEAAAVAAKGTPQEAVAVQAAEAARVRLARSQSAMRQNDPDMADAVGKSRAATDAARTTEMKALDADGAYQRAAAEQMDLEQAAIDAEQAFQAAAVKYADKPNAPPLNNARAAYRAATEVARVNAPKVDDAQKAADAARAAFDKAQQARDVATRAMEAREASLATVDDAAQRMNTRNAALEEGRELTPREKRTQAFEDMPARARTAARGTGDVARQLRNQVANFINRDGGREFNQLPEETRRQLQRFVSGGGVTQQTLDMFGALSPGLAGRSNAANALWALSAAGGTLTGGPVGGLLAALAQIGVGSAARGTGNATAAAQFNRLRDMVARGDAVLPRQPGQAGNRALNFMATEQLAGKAQ